MITTADIHKLPDSPMKRSALAQLAAQRSAMLTMPAPTPTVPRPQAGVMNKTEAAYARHLELRKIAGEVAWYAFERIVLKLAHRTHYRPDFLVWMPDGEVQCHEVKPRSGAKYFARDDAKAKVKIAAFQFPLFRFFIVWPARGGGWEKEELAGAVVQGKE